MGTIIDFLSLFKRKFLPILLATALGTACFFIPYILYNIVTPTKPILGVHYYYASESEYEIYQSMNMINDTGFKIIRTYLYTDINKTFAFYNAAKEYGLKAAVIVFNEDIGIVEHYAENYGENIAYFQILNEPELMQGWAEGALLLEEEINSRANAYIEVLNQVKASEGYTYKYYTNFSPAYMLRPDIPILLGPKLDVAGLDIYKDSGVITAHYFYKYLSKLTGKNVIITEFGISEDDDIKQTSYIMNGLKIFAGMKVPQVFLCYWSGGGEKGYTLKNRPIINEIKTWLQQ